MDLGLKGKVVVITGGTAGIGKASAEAFLAEGCKVVVCGRSEAKLKAFRAEYEGHDILAVQADVASFDDMRRLAEAAENTFGGIDVWVNNAGMYPAGDLEDMELDTWHDTFRVNVDGVLYGCRAAIPAMRRRGGGVILNAEDHVGVPFGTGHKGVEVFHIDVGLVQHIPSFGQLAGGITPTANRGAYAISKAAVHQLTRVLAAELGPDNIRVVTYNPGFVLTELNAPQVAEYPKGAIERQTAQNRLGRPEEVAGLIVFLASDRASFITGSGVEVSGGKYCVQNPAMPWDKRA